MRLNFISNFSPNFNLPKRSKKMITHIIIHYTGMTKENSAIKKLCDPKSKVSCHYFIRKNGNIHRLVPDLYTAWHAGKSNWKKKVSLNNNSIGIELHNPGHNTVYKKFSNDQIYSLIKLLKFLVKTYKINYKNILGHSDIAPNRKKDPGEKFPWKKLASYNLCLWHNLNEKRIKKFRKHKIDLFNQRIFMNNLSKIGYSKYKKKLVIIAFQRKFRQALIDGNIDKECFLISKNLLKS